MIEKQDDFVFGVGGSTSCIGIGIILALAYCLDII